MGFLLFFLLLIFGLINCGIFILVKLSDSKYRAYLSMKMHKNEPSQAI